MKYIDIFAMVQVAFAVFAMIRQECRRFSDARSGSGPRAGYVSEVAGCMLPTTLKSNLFENNSLALSFTASFNHRSKYPLRDIQVREQESIREMLCESRIHRKL